MCARIWCCACCGRSAQRWVEIFNCLVALVFSRRAGLVRLGDRRHRAAARRAQLDRSAIPDVDLLPRPARRRRADVRALRHAAAPLPVRSIDPATMTVGHAIRRTRCQRTCNAPVRTESAACGPSCSSLLFFGLLAAGMPIFLVLGVCAAVLYFGQRPAADRRGAGRHRPAQLDHADGAAAVRHGGGLHALRRRGQGAGRSRDRLARRRARLARPRHRGGLHPVRRDLRLVASRPRWPWARSCCRR